MTFYHDAPLDVLHGLVHNYELSEPDSGSDRETLIKLIDHVLPLSWMDQCTQFLQEIDADNPIKQYLNNLTLRRKIETDQLLTQRGDAIN